MKKLFLILALFTSLYAEAQHFDDYFTDATLRIDYIFNYSDYRKDFYDDIGKVS